MGDRLAGRRALITGGSRGIGRAIAEAYAAEGADVVLAATNPAKLEEARAAVAPHGGRVEAMVCDVTDRAACFALVAKAETALGGLDILVNSAGVHIPSGFLDQTPEDFSRTFTVNVDGPFHLMQAALPGMIAAGYGKIVNIASTAGKWASANQAAYNASKHAVVGLTRCLAVEMGPKGVRVNAICPGIVTTDMGDAFLPAHAKAAGTTPEAIRDAALKRAALGRFMGADDVAPLAVYLAAAESDGMTGQSIALDGGMVFV